MADDDLSRGDARLVLDVSRGPLGSFPRFLCACGNALWFAVNDGRNGEELWFSDGLLGYLSRERGDAAHPGSFAQRGAFGTRVVLDLNEGPAGSQPTSLTCLFSSLLFTASDGEFGRELYSVTLDSTSMTATVHRVRDIRRGAGSSDPQYLCAFAGRVCFAADDGEHGAKLWHSDGSARGTSRVADLSSGSAASHPRFLTPLAAPRRGGVKLFFAAQPTSSVYAQSRGPSAAAAASNGPAELWAVDGAGLAPRVFEQTEAILDLYTAALDAAWPPRLDAFRGALYFSSRRVTARLAGGAPAGRARGRRGESDTQAFAVYDVDEDQLTLKLTVQPATAGTLILGEIFGAALVSTTDDIFQVFDDLIGYEQHDGVADHALTLRGSQHALNWSTRNLSFRAALNFHGEATIVAELVDKPLKCGLANATHNNANADSCERGARGVSRGAAKVYVCQFNDASTVTAQQDPHSPDPEARLALHDGACVFDDADARETDLSVDPRSGDHDAPRLLVTAQATRGRVTLG